LAAVKSLAGRGEAVARIESEAHDVSTLEGQGQRAQSLRTTSQTVAVLQESDQQEAEQRGWIATPTPERTPAGQQRWEVSTTVLAPSTPQPVASSGPQVAAPVPSARARNLITQTELVVVSRRRRWLAGGAVVCLALVAASLAAFVAFRPASVAAPPAAVAKVPELRPIASPVAAATTVPTPAAGDKPSAAGSYRKGPGHREEGLALAASTPAQPGKAKSARAARSSKSARDCDPPFFVDRDGIRRIKAQCL
jgi:serine/threonine-protein kinase